MVTRTAATHSEAVVGVTWKQTTGTARVRRVTTSSPDECGAAVRAITWSWPGIPVLLRRIRCAPRETHTAALTAMSCTRMANAAVVDSTWPATCGILVGGMPCRLTDTGARSAVRYSNMLSILLNMKPLIRLVRSAEARRFSTYPRHLWRKHPERAEICHQETSDSACALDIGRSYARLAACLHSRPSSLTPSGGLYRVGQSQPWLDLYRRHAVRSVGAQTSARLTK